MDDEQKYRHQNGDESQDRHNLHPLASRSFKNCETFCNRLHRSYPQIYQKLQHVTKGFASNQKSSVMSYHNELKKLFGDNQDIVNDVNKLFYADARINIEKKELDPFQFLQVYFKDDHEKSRMLQDVFDVIKVQSLERQAAKELVYSKFKNDSELLKIIQNLFEQQTKKIKEKKAKNDWTIDIQRQPLKRCIILLLKKKMIYFEITKNKQSQSRFKNLFCILVQYNNYQISAKHIQSFVIAIQGYCIIINIQKKNELILFEQIRMRAQSHFQTIEEFNVFFTEFMKVISLYTDCIISHNDFTEMLTQVTWLEREVIDQICIITMSRSLARRQSTALFKPLKDTDFKNAERVTRSYVKMHPGYANTTSIIQSNNSITNQHWVSVPFGSEDYSFQIMRKNTYEEQLFKIEDEKYEFDWNILCYKRVIKVSMIRLYKLLQEILETSDKDIQKTIVIKILKLKVLQQIYQSSSQEQSEFISHLENNPTTSAPVLLERVQLKYEKLLDARNNGAKCSWEIVQMNNFHRSLDHRSFYFKKNEKQYTCISKFLKEPEERQKTLFQVFYPECNEDLNLALKKKNLEEKPFFKIEDIPYYLNSFAQLTTFEPMSKGIICPLIPSPTKQNLTCLPLFNLLLPNKELVIDTFQYLIHYSQLITSITQSERLWICKFLIQIANGLFDLIINPIDFCKIISNEQQLKTEVLIIEQTIFDANFSYLQSYQGVQSPEEPQQMNRNIKQESGSPSPDIKEPPSQLPIVDESESQLSKMLTADPSQTEQDVYTQSNVQDQGVRWLTFIPSQIDDPQLKVIYGPQGFYLFLRYFYTIYQRLEVAKHISFQFESNRKTDKLSQSDKYSLGIKRYMLFKSALFQSLKVKDFKYEDYLRSIYAKQAFLFCTIEKQFQDCCKQLANLQNDKVMESQLNIVFTKSSEDSLTQLQNLIEEFNNSSKMEITYDQLFKLDKNISEDMQLAYLTHSMVESQQEKGEKSIYRFAYSPNHDSLNVNYIPSWSQLVDRNQLQKTQLNTASYTTAPLINFRMFLRRNLRKNVQRSRALNQIEFLLHENAEMQLYEHTREDFFMARKVNQNKKKPNVLKNHIKNCFQIIEGL